MGSVGAALGQGEPCEAVVLLVSLTMLLGLDHLALSVHGLADGLGQT